MKKMIENRYPHSATLFRFCKEALALRYKGNVKVIDQDVGAILGYDPADCSHWKKGKKNIRALATLKSLAKHLQVDEQLLINITSGRLGLKEALFEYKGYSGQEIGFLNRESYRREFLKNPEKWQQQNRYRSFEEIFELDRVTIQQVVEKFTRDARFAAPPISVVEVFARLDTVTIQGDPDLDSEVVVEAIPGADPKAVLVKYHGSELKPHTRFLVVKEVFKFLCASEHVTVEPFWGSSSEILEIQSNIFALLLLVPSEQLRDAVENLDSSIDLVSQLASKFEVSKTLMNQRLQEYLSAV